MEYKPLFWLVEQLEIEFTRFSAVERIAYPTFSLFMGINLLSREQKRALKERALDTDYLEEESDPTNIRISFPQEYLEQAQKWWEYRSPEFKVTRREGNPAQNELLVVRIEVSGETQLNQLHDLLNNYFTDYFDPRTPTPQPLLGILSGLDYIPRIWTQPLYHREKEGTHQFAVLREHGVKNVATICLYEKPFQCKRTPEPASLGTLGCLMQKEIIEGDSFCY